MNPSAMDRKESTTEFNLTLHSPLSEVVHPTATKAVGTAEDRNDMFRLGKEQKFKVSP